MPDSQNRRREENKDTVQTTNEIFDVFSNDHRRFVLYYLSRHADRADVNDVLDFIVDRTPGRGPDDREKVAMALRHSHLPKLSHRGLVEYDEHGGTVIYAGHPLLDACLEHAAPRDIQGIRNSG